MQCGNYPCSGVDLIATPVTNAKKKLWRIIMIFAAYVYIHTNTIDHFAVLQVYTIQLS